MSWFAHHPPIDLDRAVVAVTGGARGIGAATAAAFARGGSRVAIGDLDTGLAESTAAALGDQARGYRLDVSDQASFAQFIQLVEQDLGPVEVLVNNAGVMPIGRFLDEPDPISGTTLRVNVFGPLHGMRLVLPGMVERGRGHVVNVASLCGRTYLPGLAVYGASKSAVIAMTDAVRAELAGSGVTLTTVLPSMVRTELAAGIPVPGPAATQPEHIARAIVHSVRTRRPNISVPFWVGHTVTLTNLLPTPLQRLARRAIRDDRGLAALDNPTRAGYIARVNTQAQQSDPHSPTPEPTSHQLADTAAEGTRHAR